MKNKKYVLIRADRREIIKEPKFFNTYDEVFEEMKEQYEASSDGGVGELNDDDAWCIVNGDMIEWQIYERNTF